VVAAVLGTSSSPSHSHLGVGADWATSPWTPSPWTALHQWSPLSANITLVRRPDDEVEENVTRRWRILHITDAHISLAQADEHGRGHTRRMHEAFRTEREKYLGARSLPADTFQRLIHLAHEVAADAVVLTGDIVNFPHNASVQYVSDILSTARRAGGARMPVIYTSGNHDWFVEGLQQSVKAQRKRFRREILRPLYAGNRRSGCASSWSDESDREDCTLLELGGEDRSRTSEAARSRSGGTRAPELLILAIDNAAHEVTGAQAAFVWRELARGLPTLLAVHVPFMLAGATPKQNKQVLCGDPRYGHDSDPTFRIENRERWPKSGSTPTTLRFVEDIVRRFAAPRGPLIGVIGGHEHLHRADVVGQKRSPPALKLQCDASEPPRCTNANRGHQAGVDIHEGLVQYVTLPAVQGGHRLIEVRDARPLSWQGKHRFP